MASLKYLWQNRAHFPIGSVSWFKAWAKRMLTMRVLVRRNNRRKSLLRKGAQIASTAEIGKTLFNGNKKNLSIGEFSFIGKAELALHDSIQIGSRVCINDGVQLLTASHDVIHSNWPHKKAPITINDYAWIATNVIILPGITIGEGAVVGAGAIVTKNVPAYAIAAGNPATILKKSRIKELDYNPCEFLAANNAWLKG